MDVGKIELPPNIRMMLHGCTSGRYSEWPVLRAEVRDLVEENRVLKEKIKKLEGRLALCDCAN